MAWEVRSDQTRWGSSILTAGRGQRVRDGEALIALSSASPGAKLAAYGHEGWKSEHGNLDRLPSTELGSPRRPETDEIKDGAFVVVGARESRARGEGKQKDGRFA
jgi:hypothetical protein